MVPRLRSWERNRLALDVVHLPAEAEVTRTNLEVVPAHHGGVLVDLSVMPAVSALIQVVDTVGRPLEAGLNGTTGTGEGFVVGYDGEAFLRGLADMNTLTIEREDGTSCEARFRFERQPGQTRIGPIACR